MVRMWTTIVLLLVLTGCIAQEDEIDSNCIIRFSAKVDNPEITLNTRTSISTGAVASFISGDQIGITETLTGRNNVRFSYNGSTWNTTTPMYWLDGTSVHTFYAYYPYNATNTGTTITIPNLSTQKTTTRPDSICDLLITGAKTQVRSTSANVPLTFRHGFALLQFNMNNGILGLGGALLNSMTINGGNTIGGTARYGIVNRTNDVTKIGYNLTTDSILATPNNAATYTQSFTSNTPRINLLTTSATIYVFVLPGIYQNPVPSVSFNLGLFNVKANLPNKGFSANRKYIYGTTISVLGLDTRSDTGEAEMKLTLERVEPLSP